jgi:hypothetical protein
MFLMAKDKDSIFVLKTIGVVILGSVIFALLGQVWGSYQNNKEREYMECLELRNEFNGMIVKTQEDYYKSEYGKYYALEQCRHYK